MSTPFFGATVDFHPVQIKVPTSLICYRLLDTAKSFSSFCTNYSTVLSPRCRGLRINNLTKESFLTHVADSGQHVGPRSLRGWRFPGKSGAIRYWRSNRRLCRWHHPDRPGDRPPGQQRRRIRCPDGG